MGALVAETPWAELRELRAEVARLRDFERFVVCHWCQERWKRGEVPALHVCEENPLVKALRSTEEFLADMEASDNPACDPDSTAWLMFAPLLSQVRAILREASRG